MPALDLGQHIFSPRKASHIGLRSCLDDLGLHIVALPDALRLPASLGLGMSLPFNGPLMSFRAAIAATGTRFLHGRWFLSGLVRDGRRRDGLAFEFHLGLLMPTNPVVRLAEVSAFAGGA
jgi:hypothetical protein